MFLTWLIFLFFIIFKLYYFFLLVFVTNCKRLKFLFDIYFSSHQDFVSFSFSRQYIFISKPIIKHDLMFVFFRVIAVDLKGFGDSDKPSWRRNYKIQNLLDEIYELIFSLQYKVCTIIGHDLGAHIGWYFVTEFPEIVEKFVAISCPHPNVFWEYTSTPSRFDSRQVT